MQHRTAGRTATETAFGIFLLGLLAGLPAGADELVLDAEHLFSHGVSDHLRLADEGHAIELQRGVLFEDDGPAAGYSYHANEERLVPGVWLKKELMIPAPRAAKATLLVGRGGELGARINGKPVTLGPSGRQGNYWQSYDFSPDLLRPGKNEFVLHGHGSVWIARDDEFAAGSLTRQTHPNRSAKSHDEGKSWSYTQLGTDSNLDGEYYVRVFLDQFQTQGRLTLDVIDVGNLAAALIGPPVTSLGPIHIQAETAANSGDAIEMRVRTGTSYVPCQEHWSDWAPFNGAGGVIDKPMGRYLQLELQLSTTDPLSTPRLRRVTISAAPLRPKDWTSGLRVIRFDNPAIIRSSIPFQYEPFDRPELLELRRTYELDKIVAGAETEFEVITRLAAWSATRWQRMHLKESYPCYNALEILKLHPDGTPVGGFCQQSNLVFLQACESFGLTGRMVSLGPGHMTEKIRSGHETVEIWSNEFGKWIYIDGNTAWYAIDQATKVPLSCLELRQRQLAAFRDGNPAAVKVITLAETKYSWPGMTSWPPLVELRLIPRSNFLQEKSPLPLNQGMRGWFWTGHYVWVDDQEPARLLYTHRCAKRANFEWTLNQAHVVFEATEPGTLRAHVDTQTPGFKQFLRRTGEVLAATQAVFDWSLSPGRNRLFLVPQNIAGRNGIAADIEIDWK